jgi:hypothetical protein
MGDGVRRTSIHLNVYNKFFDLVVAGGLIQAYEAAA